jgi:predicted permease
VIRQLNAFLRNIFHKERIDHDLDEEIRSYLELVSAEKVRGGMSPGDAAREARREIGGLEQVKENVRDIRIGGSMDALMQDLRYGLRTLLKHRSFTVVAVLTLALGIGACTAIFSLVNAVFLRSLPYGEPHRLVYLYSPNVHFALPTEVFPPRTADYFDLKKQNHSFAKTTLFAQATYNVAVGDRAERIGAARVDEDFFNTLQCAAEFGRVFSENDERPGNAHVVVISHAVWQGMFGGRTDILGRALRLDGQPYRVVGVMPQEFGFPHKSDVAYSNPHIETTQLWVPSALTSEERTEREGINGFALARLKPGVTLREAQAEMSTLIARLELLHYPRMRGLAGFVKPFRDSALGPVRPLMRILLGAVGLVFLITCTNAASLFLARAANRTHELGVRATLGAGRGRLLRQMLTESWMLSTAAGLAGVGLAYLFLHALLKLNPGDIPRMEEATLDVHVMAFLVAVTMLTSILFGILHSVAATRINVTAFLNSGGMRGVVGNRSLVRRGLTIAQIALVVVLLAGTGLLLRSYVNVLSVPTGFASSTIAVNVQLSAEMYTEKMNPRYNSMQKQQAFFREALDRIKPIQGIQAAGLIDVLPLSTLEALAAAFEIEGSSANETSQPMEMRRITAGYLSAMQVPLMKGRDFTDQDGPGQPPVAIVNETFAKKFFRGGDAIGHRLRMSPRTPWITIIGVTGDVRNMGLEASPPAQVYTSLWQTSTDEAIKSAYITVRCHSPKLRSSPISGQPCEISIQI